MKQVGDLGGGDGFGHGICLEARGLTKEQLIAEAARSTLDELADWTVEADRVLTF